MAVRSKRLWGPTTVGATSVTLYTAPAGKTAIVKLFSVVNVSGATRSYSLRINGTTDAELVLRNGISDQSTQQNQGNFWVLNPGDVLRCIADGTSIHVTGFGALLDGYSP